MSLQSQSPEPMSPAQRAAEDAAYYRRVLHGVIDAGADMVRVVQLQATAEVAPEPMADAAVAYERIARSIRRTIALARRLDEPVKAEAAREPGQRRAAARARIRSEVEAAIEQEAEGADADDLREDLRDRIDGPDADDELDQRPVEEIIAEICRDLGLRGVPGTVVTCVSRRPRRAAQPVVPLAQLSDDELAVVEAKWDAWRAGRAGRWPGD
jgi:hypothetical protein